MFAILAAGGSGSRMGAISVPNKLFLPLTTSHSVFQCSVNSLVASGACRGLCIVARPEDMPLIAIQLSELEIDLEVLTVSGGATRAQSVQNGLEALRGRASYVLIHDAARPLCSPTAIRTLADCVRKKQAALLAVPVRGTLKRSEGDERVLCTVSRDGMWEAQTPQGFAFGLLDEAYAAAGDSALLATDDSQIVEEFGHEVWIVPGAVSNIKITTPEDLIIARAIAQST